MKEIKFRLWDNKNMWQNPIIHHGKAWCYNNEETELVPWYSKEQTILYGEPILMQYTGLKDKNGIEIYEGDIIKVNDNDGVIFEVAGVIASIIFERGAFRFECYEGFKKVLDDGDCLEVIGNIYENPDLLNHKERRK